MLFGTGGGNVIQDKARKASQALYHKKKEFSRVFFFDGSLSLSLFEHLLLIMVSKSVSAQKSEQKKYKQSKHARYDAKINRIKHKCRSGRLIASVHLPSFTHHSLLAAELDLFNWQKWKFHENDYWIDSFVDTLTRIDYRSTSKSEFIKQYEAKNIPVMMTHVTDHWKANKHWTEEVNVV